MIFGKRLSEYVAFEKGVYVSITAVGIAAVFYLGIVTWTKGFGSYRQLLPLMVLVGIVTHTIVIAGILISAATGTANIFTAPEYGGSSSVPLHVAAHIAGGMVVGPLISWAISSLVLFVTKKVTPARSSVAAA